MLELLKTMPLLLGICYFCNSLLSYFYIDNFVLSHIAGVSLIPFVYIYASSFLFKFCIYHRLPLDYIAVNECINIYDYYCGIPVSNIDLLLIHIIIAWLVIIFIVILYVKSYKRSPAKFY